MLHIPRFPLPSFAACAQPHHGVAHSAVIADATTTREGRLAGAFVRRGCVDGEGVNTACKLGRQGLINHAMTFKSALSLKRIRYDINPVVGLSAGPMSGMAFMLMGFVQHPETLGCESLGQLLCDQICGSHAAPLRRGLSAGQWSESKVLNASLIKAHNVRS